MFCFRSFFLFFFLNFFLLGVFLFCFVLFIFFTLIFFFFFFFTEPKNFDSPAPSEATSISSSKSTVTHEPNKSVVSTDASVVPAHSEPKDRSPIEPSTKLSSDVGLQSDGSSKSSIYSAPDEPAPTSSVLSKDDSFTSRLKETTTSTEIHEATPTAQDKIMEVDTQSTKTNITVSQAELKRQVCLSLYIFYKITRSFKYVFCIICL